MFDEIVIQLAFKWWCGDACFQGSVEPFILKSQLYSSVKDRTQVDRELEVCLLRNLDLVW